MVFGLSAKRTVDGVVQYDYTIKGGSFTWSATGGQDGDCSTTLSPASFTLPATSASGTLTLFQQQDGRVFFAQVMATGRQVEKRIVCKSGPPRTEIAVPILVFMTAPEGGHSDGNLASRLAAYVRVSEERGKPIARSKLTADNVTFEWSLVPGSIPMNWKPDCTQEEGRVRDAKNQADTERDAIKRLQVDLARVMKPADALIKKAQDLAPKARTELVKHLALVLFQATLDALTEFEPFKARYAAFSSAYGAYDDFTDPTGLTDIVQYFDVFKSYYEIHQGSLDAITTVATKETLIAAKQFAETMLELKKITNEGRGKLNQIQSKRNALRDAILALHAAEQDLRACEGR